jgi:hypothetical protein
MLQRNLILMSILGALGALPAISAASTVLPAAYGNEQLASGPNTLNQNGFGTFNLYGAGYSSATSEPGYVSASSPQPDGSGAGASSYYYFSVDTTGGSSTALIDIAATVFATGTNAEAYVSFGSVYVAYTNVDGFTEPLQTQFTVPTNTPLLIGLYAQAALTGTTEGSSSYADPYIYLDPSVANPSAYTIQVDPGVSNTPTPVPLPAAALLLLSGIGSLGLVGRRRSLN